MNSPTKSIRQAIFIFFLFPTTLFSSQETYYKAEITQVLDGDTFEAIIDLNYIGLLHKTSIRLADANAPEIFKPKSKEEKIKGLLAKAFLENLCKQNQNTFFLHIKGQDKYGRILAIAYPNTDNESIGQKLKKANLAE